MILSLIARTIIDLQRYMYTKMGDGKKREDRVKQVALLATVANLKKIFPRDAISGRKHTVGNSINQRFPFYNIILCHIH